MLQRPEALKEAGRCWTHTESLYGFRWDMTQDLDVLSLDSSIRSYRVFFSISVVPK